MEPAHRGLRRREQVLDALVEALRRRDEFVAVVASADDADGARTRLMAAFGFDAIQANAVLDMQVRRMTVVELQRLEVELGEIRAQLLEIE